MLHLTKIVRALWDYLREVSGENDYSHYCARALRQGIRPVSCQAFYLSQQELKHSRPTRCC
jgi:Selenoprotein, putative